MSPERQSDPLRAAEGISAEARSPDVRWHPGHLPRETRWALLGRGGTTVWLTGLPASGKSTIAAALERRLVEDGRAAYLLDGDNIRHGLSGDLGFGPEARAENARRVGHVARLFADAGVIPCVALVSPFREDRWRARALHDAADLPFVEVFVDTDPEECRRRDPKGLYERSSAGGLTGMTGADAPYERPLQPEVWIRTAQTGVDEAVELVLRAIEHPRPAPDPADPFHFLEE